MALRRHIALLVLVVLVVVLALAVTLPRPAAAQAWQSELAEQIAEEQDCEVGFLSHVIERDLDGRLVVMAKVHCTDKRTFDALRTDQFELFRITLCEDPNVGSC